MKIRRFLIGKLFGDRDVSLVFDGNALVIVGPNGLGKSSVASIFYLTVSRQWNRLLDFDFERLEIDFSETSLVLKRNEISGLAAFRDALKREPASGRLQGFISRLSEARALEEFMSIEKLTLPDRRRFSEIISMPAIEVQSFQRFLKRRFAPENDLFEAPRLALESQLSEAFSGRILYLPTYRRIEKDVKDIFPGIEDKLRRYGEVQPIEAGRSGEFFVEFVSFGMDDVKKKIEVKTQEIRNYSLAQYNDLSASYLRDVIRGQADKFPVKAINALNEKNIADILARVNEATLSREDKRVLRSRIKGMQNLSRHDLQVEDRYLAHYFSRLVKITSDITEKEKQISSFIKVCNRYLKPGKLFVYDEIGFDLKVVNESGAFIDLKFLSSGEKQIISLFSHLYLEERQNSVIVIDEPELSLSVPWQRTFLTDILASDPSCFMLAVTHSPFVYENELKAKSVDLRKFTKKAVN